MNSKQIESSDLLSGGGRCCAVLDAESFPVLRVSAGILVMGWAPMCQSSCLLDGGSARSFCEGGGSRRQRGSAIVSKMQLLLCCLNLHLHLHRLLPARLVNPSSLCCIHPRRLSFGPSATLVTVVILHLRMSSVAITLPLCQASLPWLDGAVLDALPSNASSHFLGTHAGPLVVC